MILTEDTAENLAQDAGIMARTHANDPPNWDKIIKIVSAEPAGFGSNRMFRKKLIQLLSRTTHPLDASIKTFNDDMLIISRYNIYEQQILGDEETKKTAGQLYMEQERHSREMGEKLMEHAPKFTEWVRAQADALAELVRENNAWKNGTLQEKMDVLTQALSCINMYAAAWSRSFNTRPGFSTEISSVGQLTQSALLSLVQRVLFTLKPSDDISAALQNMPEWQYKKLYTAPADKRFPISYLGPKTISLAKILGSGLARMKKLHGIPETAEDAIGYAPLPPVQNDVRMTILGTKMNLLYIQIPLGGGTFPVEQIMGENLEDDQEFFAAYREKTDTWFFESITEYAGMRDFLSTGTEQSLKTLLYWSRQKVDRILKDNPLVHKNLDQISKFHIEIDQNNEYTLFCDPTTQEILDGLQITGPQTKEEEKQSITASAPPLHQRCKEIFSTRDITSLQWNRVSWLLRHAGLVETHEGKGSHIKFTNPENESFCTVSYAFHHSSTVDIPYGTIARWLSQANLTDAQIGLIEGFLDQ